MSPTSRVSANLLIGLFLGAISSHFLWNWIHKQQNSEEADEIEERGIVEGVTGLIGHTPLVRIKSLSEALGVEILGKAEFLNPGGSVKDRVALRVIDDAEASGLLRPHTGSRIFEGTVGSTGISIATIAAARGYETTIIMPDDVAEEKALALRALTAEVEKVRPASIVDKKQFVNLAKRRAKEFGERYGTSDHNAQKIGFFADQFETKSNFDAHFDGTGPEIWRQTRGKIDMFVSGAGTGGTIAGIGVYLKQMNPNIKVVLADPEGSGLYFKVQEGVMFDPRESEGRKRRHQVDTVVEGIGINRITKNFQLALPIIDEAIRVTDEDAVSMSRYIVKHDGLFLGSSSACNLVAAVRAAKKLPPGSRIVTILCDSGSRHYSKFWNEKYLESIGISNNAANTEKMLRE